MHFSNSLRDEAPLPQSIAIQIVAGRLLPRNLLYQHPRFSVNFPVFSPVLRRRAWVKISAHGSQVGDDLEEQEIAIAEFIVDAFELVRRGVHFLEVAENVAVVPDGADVTAGLDHRVDKGGDLALQHKPPRFKFRHVHSSSSNARRPGEKWRG